MASQIEQAVPGRVLVVDDDRVSRLIVSRALERAGLTVDQARDGVEALDQLTLHTPDMVILDVTLPRLSGLEVLHAIRQRFGTIDMPVIMISARSEVDDVLAALHLGANDYITKPIDFGLLVRRCNTAIAHRALARRSMLLERRLELLYASTCTRVSLHAADGRFLEASPALLALLAVTAEEVIHTSLHDWLHPDDVAGLVAMEHDMPDAYRLVARVSHGDGYAWFEVEQAALRDGVTQEVIAVQVVWMDRSRDVQVVARSGNTEAPAEPRSFAFTPAPAEARRVAGNYGPPVDVETTPMPWPRKKSDPPRVVPGLDEEDRVVLISQLEQAIKA